MFDRPHVSYSELAQFVRECQHKWYLDYHLGHRSTKYSIHFDFGTAIHAALECHLRRKKPVSLEHAKKVFEKKLRFYVKRDGGKYDKKITDADLEGLVVSGLRILDYVDKVPELQGAEYVHNEYKLFEDIEHEDAKVKFKGYIDLVFKGKDKRGKTILWVCDFKTCSWGWDRETREDRWKHFQLFLYKYYLCKKFNIDPTLVRTAFILLKKRPAKGAPVIEFFPVSAGPVSVQRALDEVGSALTEMVDRGKDDSYLKNRDNCVDKYGNRCPYFGTPLCP